MKHSGIYQILNKINGHSYIGSSDNIQTRWNRHAYDLQRGQHHSIPLQRAYLKYGKDNLLFIIMELISNSTPELLLTKEQEWIDKLKPVYNIGSVGGGDNISKHPNLAQIKQKHSNNLKKRWLEPEFRASQIKRLIGESNPNWKGGICSPTCQQCNTPISYQHKLCVLCSKLGSNNPFFGKTHTQETRQKQRLKMLGKKPVNQKRVYVEGFIYPSATEASRQIGVCPATILFRIKSKHWNYHYV
jgi:group I intron endonuclease